MNQQVPIYLKPVEKIGKVVSDLIGGLGEFTTFNFKVLFWMFKTPYRPALFFEQMYFVGNKSLLIILMTSVFFFLAFSTSRLSEKYPCVYKMNLPSLYCWSLMRSRIFFWKNGFTKHDTTEFFISTDKLKFTHEQG